MFSSLEFFISEAWTGFRRCGIMSLVSTGTITVSLVVFGAFLMLVFNLGGIVGSIGSKMEVMAYTDTNLDEWKANALSLEVSRLPGVAEVKYISRDEAWKNFKQDFEGRLALGEIVKENPLPNTLIVKVKDPKYVSTVAEQISNIQIINEVRYSGKLAERVEFISSAIRLGGLVLVLLLGFATLLIVVNTIRLTVLARQADITVMKLVGATDTFIKWPFIIEGLLIGIIGSALSFVILKFTYDTIIIRLQQALPFLPLLTSQRELMFIYLIVASVGTALGISGGYISVTRALKEQL